MTYWFKEEKIELLCFVLSRAVVSIIVRRRGGSAHLIYKNTNAVGGCSEGVLFGLGGGARAPPMRDPKFKFDERVKNDWDAHGNLLRPGHELFPLWLFLWSRGDDPNSGPLKFVAGAIK